MEKGFAAVGMREISAQAGLSPMQAYRIGLAKEDLLAEISISLSVDQLATITAEMAAAPDETPQKFVERYLLRLYQSDIEHMAIRKESAAYGWMWSSKYESRIITQVLELLAPVVEVLKRDGLSAIPDRCFAIWALYYVGYRAAVMNGACAPDCLNAIKGSLALVLRK